MLTNSGEGVLISKNTPWLNLEVDKLGWSCELDDIDSFVDVINNKVFWDTRRQKEFQDII